MVKNQIFFLILFVEICWINKICKCKKQDRISIESIQAYNEKILLEALPLGWKEFCEAEVDEAVMSFFPGSSVADGVLSILRPSNDSIEILLKDLTQLGSFNLDCNKTTIVYINTFLSDSIYDIRGNLEFLQHSRTDLNIIVVDFGLNIFQLYNTIKHNIYEQGYFVLKLISELLSIGVKHNSMILVGHSVGANIAALAADLYNEHNIQNKLPLLIAIDPSSMCHHDEIFVNQNVCDQVVVIHGENDIFGIPSDIGTIDIYPNGDTITIQPGCKTNICSHVYPLLLFLEAAIKETEILAVQCKNWGLFRRGQCDYGNVIDIGLKYNNSAKGKYYCITKANQPYSLEELGLKYSRKLNNICNNGSKEE